MDWVEAQPVSAMMAMMDMRFILPAYRKRVNESMARERHGRIVGRRGVALRKQRIASAPLCIDCLTKGRTTATQVIDHILPLALGGTDTDDNVRGLCHDCHEIRTAEQFGHKAKQSYGLDGWPT